MVRRSTVDRSPQAVVHGAGYEAGPQDLATGSVPPGRSATWRGAGGRWLVWVFRVVAWLVVLLIGYRGVSAIITSETAPTSGAATTSAPQPGFPVTLAEAFALQFGQAYLNASPAGAVRRASELAAFLPAGADPQLGWDGSGSLRLDSEQVAGIDVRDSHHAIVTLLARVNGNLMELGVPVYAVGSGMTVSGNPAWLPAPSRVSPPAASTVTTDIPTQSVLFSQLPAFFQAYASGDQLTLGRFLAPGTQLAGLGGEVTFGTLTGLTVPYGGSTRQIVATVLWRIPQPPQSQPRQVGQAAPSAGLTMNYALTVVKRSGTWYVASISPTTLPAGQP